ncbi:MAG: hypothetical protein ACWA5R_03850 [bacterium]
MENNILWVIEEAIHDFDTELLRSAINDEVNVLKLMHEELADRGISLKTGEHIGHIEASDEMQERWKNTEI